MTVGIKIEGVTSEVGSADFFNAFFSTVHVRLESGVWGARFPVILGDLYQGRIVEDKAESALQELQEISARLADFAPTEVVWDSENLQARPPWGDDIASDITNLSNYFVTSTGRDLLGMIRECLDSSISMGGDLVVVTY